jgi:hypothetical protein
MDLEHIAIDFYERNCADCKDRKPVRLPNLLQLVQQKTREQQAQAERARRATEIEAADVEARTKRRLALRAGTDRATSEILDILDRLDHNPTSQDSEVLAETARAVADKFDEHIQEALFELADAGGWTRTEAAIEALNVVSRDRSRLAGVALKAFARGDALDSAGSIVSKHLDRSHEPLVEAAMPSLIYLASPVPSGMGMAGRPGDDEPLLASYRLFPAIAKATIAAMLHSPHKDDRIHACHAVVALTGEDHGLVPAVASSLIASLQLPDDHYGQEGSAGQAVARTFAEAMLFLPDEIDSILQGAMTAVSGPAREELFQTYEKVLRSQEAGPERPPTDADNVAFQRIVEVLAQRPRDGRFNLAGSFAREEMPSHPSLVDANAEVLLGAAALIAGDLENPYSSLLDPRPDALKAIEEETHRLELATALNALADVIGSAAGRNPKTVGQQLVQTLDRLEDGHGRLRAALVVSLGILARSRDGLAIALPELYTAMMDSAVGVRAAGASAYSKLASGSSDDLPDLIHQSYLVLLADPYVAVHMAALRALEEINLPERFRADALERVAVLIITYAKEGRDDGFLAICIEQFARLSRENKNLTVDTLRFLVDILGRMSPSEAARFIVHHGRQFQGTPGFAKLLVKLLADQKTYDFHLDDLTEELGAVSASEINELDEEIRTAWKTCLDRGVDLTDELLEVFTVAGAWNAAAELARQANAQLDDSRWNRPHKLYAAAREAAAKLEHSAATGETNAVTSSAAEWRQIYQEIGKDDEENAEARNPLKGVRFPSEDE